MNRPRVIQLLLLRVVGELIGALEGFVEHKAEVAAQVVRQWVAILHPREFLAKWKTTTITH